MDNDNDNENGVSRRNLLAGLGAVAAGAGAFALPANASAGAPPIVAVNLYPEVLDAALPGLTYLPIDGFDFQPDTNYAAGGRYASDNDGVGTNNAGQIAASLPLPVGSVIRQINIGYRG